MERNLEKFDTRNTLKKSIHQYTQLPHIKEREMRSTHLWMNVWDEQHGVGADFQRPVLVIKKFWSMFFVAPMTTWGKDNRYYYTLPKEIFGKTSRIMLSQARFVDRRRFTYKVRTLDKKHFLHIKEKLKDAML